ncbi:hypothetical protein RHMOL_Rhmol12G0233300 [Rhododendron molle]|uniref:Uncharacterized protein n=1 Tax=Rhododendron molle TaxID=49168 RepID=A0ACC0LLP5_RHOML|nr:hypothetical protein RHMOL_Rhmol12G0233300 [Rhododendron molle]
MEPPDADKEPPDADEEPPGENDEEAPEADEEPPESPPGEHIKVWYCSIVVLLQSLFGVEDLALWRDRKDIDLDKRPVFDQKHLESDLEMVYELRRRLGWWKVELITLFVDDSPDDGGK